MVSLRMRITLIYPQPLQKVKSAPEINSAGRCRCGRRHNHIPVIRNGHACHKGSIEHVTNVIGMISRGGHETSRKMRVGCVGTTRGVDGWGSSCHRIVEGSVEIVWVGGCWRGVLRQTIIYNVLHVQHWGRNCCWFWVPVTQTMRHHILHIIPHVQHGHCGNCASTLGSSSCHRWRIVQGRAIEIPVTWTMRHHILYIISHV
mmetsp:Transcript_15572/g.33542  ORF Transcript_15572/g.33542 Transcript_15572/m.33542 type:complete len:202 (-) Transcript_15572:1226-1831(-)